MQLVTYTHKYRSRIGILDGDTVVHTTFEVDMRTAIERGVRPGRTSMRHALDEVTLHAPLKPGKVICVGRNYVAHAEELGNEVPPEPLLFAKLPSSVIGRGQAIQWYERDTTQVDWEGELAVVIGKPGRNIAVGDAYHHIFGYTVANDVSARDLQSSESQWLRAKGMDTFLPLGPAIVTADAIPDPHKLTVTTTVNGEQMQHSNTGLMVYNVPMLVSYISRTFTLMPGDLILTGTPSGVGKGMNPPRFLKDGDTVTVTIDGLGALSNPCQILS